MDYTDIVCVLSFADSDVCDGLAQEWLDDIETLCEVRDFYVAWMLSCTTSEAA